MREHTREQAWNLARHELDRIVAAHDAGNRRQTSQLVRAYLVKDIVKLDAAYRTLGGQASYREARKLADQINLFRFCEEPVIWWHKQKRTSGCRPICALPRKLDAAHRIIADVLYAQFRPGDHLFGIKGRGRDALTRHLQTTLQQGCGYTIQGDLRDAFLNVKVGALSALPLPPSVIQATLDTDRISFRYDPAREKAQAVASRGLSPAGDIHTVRRTRANRPCGLMQGSPASNVILAWLFNDLPDVLPPGCVPYLYADNVLVAARMNEQCRLIEQTLTSYFDRHGAGRFALDKIKVQTVDVPHAFVEFLGYEFERETKDAVVTIVPNHFAVTKITEECCDDAEMEAKQGCVSPQASQERLRQKLSGFSAASDLSYFLESIKNYVNETFQEAIWDIERSSWPTRYGPY